MKVWNIVTGALVIALPIDVTHGILLDGYLACLHTNSMKVWNIRSWHVEWEVKYKKGEKEMGITVLNGKYKLDIFIIIVIFGIFLIVCVGFVFVFV
jgi:hypothetical protein